MASKYNFHQCKCFAIHTNFAFVEIPFNHMIHIIIIICGYLNSDLFFAVQVAATGAISHTANKPMFHLYPYVCSMRGSFIHLFVSTIKIEIILRHRCTHVHRERTTSAFPFSVCIHIINVSISLFTAFNVTSIQRAHTRFSRTKKEKK